MRNINHEQLTTQTETLGKKLTREKNNKIIANFYEKNCHQVTVVFAKLLAMGIENRAITC